MGLFFFLVILMASYIFIIFDLLISFISRYVLQTFLCPVLLLFLMKAQQKVRHQ